MRALSFLLMLAVVSLPIRLMFAEEDRDDSKAIAKIELLGGRVVRDHMLLDSPVVLVTFEGSNRFNDKYLHLLGSFKKLTTINLNGCGQVTDAGLAAFCELGELTDIDLGRTNITDDGLNELASLKNLTSLNLAATKITSKGLTSLCKLENLTTLNLSGTRVTDEGLKSLSKLKNLTDLSLRKTRITDRGLKEIREFEKLIDLDIRGNQITDVSLVEMVNVKSLLWLWYDGNIAASGVKELKKSLPGLEIIQR